MSERHTAHIHRGCQALAVNGRRPFWISGVCDGPNQCCYKDILFSTPLSCRTTNRRFSLYSSSPPRFFSLFFFFFFNFVYLPIETARTCKDIGEIQHADRWDFKNTREEKKTHKRRRASLSRGAATTRPGMHARRVFSSCASVCFSSFTSLISLHSLGTCESKRAPTRQYIVLPTYTMYLLNIHSRLKGLTKISFLMISLRYKTTLNYFDIESSNEWARYREGLDGEKNG